MGAQRNPQLERGLEEPVVIGLAVGEVDDSIDAGPARHAPHLGDGFLDATLGEDREAEESLRVCRGVLLGEPVVVAPADRDVDLDGDVEAAGPEDRGEQQVGVDAVLVQLADAAVAVTGTRDVGPVADPDGP